MITGKWKEKSIPWLEAMIMTTGNKRNIIRISRKTVIWLVVANTTIGNKENMIKKVKDIIKARKWDIIQMPGCRDNSKVKKSLLTCMRNYLTWCKMVRLFLLKTRDLKREKALLWIFKSRTQKVINPKLLHSSDQENNSSWLTELKLWQNHKITTLKPARSCYKSLSMVWKEIINSLLLLNFKVQKQLQAFQLKLNSLTVWLLLISFLKLSQLYLVVKKTMIMMLNSKKWPRKFNWNKIITFMNHKISITIFHYSEETMILTMDLKWFQCNKL